MVASVVIVAVLSAGVFGGDTVIPSSLVMDDAHDPARSPSSSIGELF
eukprot:CAMPEP_0176467760 /NCGR_PEP_ID=MMETSP0127-20121128/38639_1 /TAXON_ID=938130 /ORGANISM="Platyophrya macrostoma, Strain WH" /LENGTH=46 /DNA_ID= /DNA_START= /DNA_END= /DNA_ORIENTATION=